MGNLRARLPPLSRLQAAKEDSRWGLRGQVSRGRRCAATRRCTTTRARTATRSASGTGTSSSTRRSSTKAGWREQCTERDSQECCLRTMWSRWTFRDCRLRDLKKRWLRSILLLMLPLLPHHGIRYSAIYSTIFKSHLWKAIFAFDSKVWTYLKTQEFKLKNISRYET